MIILKIARVKIITFILNSEGNMEVFIQDYIWRKNVKKLL